jgi:hypothetical protein
MSQAGSFDHEAAATKKGGLRRERASASRLPWWALAAALIATVMAWATSGRDRADNLIHGAPVRASFTRHPERISDGVIALDGARWNSRLSSEILNGGSLEWDLGEPRAIDRGYLQADHDDTYAVLVSVDGSTWSTLWEAPPVSGSGLRTRTTDDLHARARFVRLEPRGGDGRAFVSELVLASSTARWPPLLKTKHDESIDDPASPPWIPLLLPALTIGILAVTSPWAFRRRGGRRKRWWQEPLLWTTIGAAAFLCITALWYAKLDGHNVEDDGYISLQYAKNWITGHGLVFNPGERVEGYTNFLWVALLAPAFLAVGRDPGLFARAAGMFAIALAALSVALVAFIGRRVFRSGRVAAALSVLLLAFDDSFVGYTTTYALENHLLTALVLSGLALAVYRPRGFEWWLGLSFALVGMTRPDGLLWVIAFFLVNGVRRFRGTGTSNERWTDVELTRVAVAFALPFGGYFAARWAYYGDPLPNTFYLKVGSTFDAVARGIQYLRSFVGDRFYIPVLALVAIWRARSLWSQWLFAYAGLHIAFVVYVGGDFYAGHRFFLVLLPMLALSLGSLADWWLESRARGRDHAAIGLERSMLRSTSLHPALTGLALCMVWRAGTLLHGPYTSDLFWNATMIDNNVAYMRWLRDVARADSSMVVGDIGATGLFADVRVIDYFGVVDRAVAHKHVPNFGTGKAGHEKVLTRDEALSRQPTYIKWGYVGDNQYPPGYYIFNAFPLWLRVEGLWVKDDLAIGRALEETAFHFGALETESWTREGSAFARVARGPAPGQRYVNGQFGEFIDSFSPEEGDRATGHLSSPDFVLNGDRIRLLVGGGRDPDRLYVTLWVEGRRVFSETGTDWETLGRREWDIDPLRGKTAHIEIVDEAKGAWGHILVDEVVQWVGSPNRSGKL